MPTYGYRCPEGHEFEVWQSMTDEAAADCPECGKAARRLFFPAGIVFKGTGFYKTDSRSGSTITTPPSKPAEKKSETPSTSSGDTSTDKK